MDEPDGHAATQDPRGLRSLPRRHPREANRVNGIATGEPGDRKRSRRVREGGAEKDPQGTSPASYLDRLSAVGRDARTGSADGSADDDRRHRRGTDAADRHPARRAGRWAPHPQRSTAVGARPTQAAPAAADARAGAQRARAPGRCSRCCTASGSLTSRRRRPTRRCWTRAPTCARPARCTGSSPPTTAGSASGATSSPTRRTQAGAARPAAERAVEVGRVEAEGPGEVDVLLPVRGAPRLLGRFEEMEFVMKLIRAIGSGWPAGVSPVRGDVQVPGSDAPVRGREAGCEAGRMRPCGLQRE